MLMCGSHLCEISFSALPKLYSLNLNCSRLIAHVLNKSTHFTKTLSVKSLPTLTIEMYPIFKEDLNEWTIRVLLSELYFLSLRTNINALIIWTEN